MSLINITKSVMARVFRDTQQPKEENERECNRISYKRVFTYFLVSSGLLLLLFLFIEGQIDLNDCKGNGTK